MSTVNTYKIGISGHRNLANPEYIRLEICDFLAEQKKKHSNILAISALAEGADSIFAKEALKLSIPLEVILPFPLNHYKETFTDDEAVDTLEELYQKSKFTSSILDEKPKTKDIRRQAYLDCGKAIVDQSNMMLLVYDGQPVAGKGGTGDIYDYCKNTNKNYLHILPFNHNHQIINLMESKRKELYANQKKKMHNTLWHITLIFATFAALVLTFSKSFKIAQERNWPFILGVIEIALFFIALVLYLYLEKSKTKTQRIETRRNSQVLKRYLIYLKSCLPIRTLPNVNLYDPYISQDVIGLIKQAKTNKDHGLEFQKEEIKKFLIEQKNYFEKDKNSKTHHKIEKLEILQKIVLVLFIIGLVFLFLFNINVYIVKSLKEWVTFSSLFFPILLGAIEGYIYFKDDRRIVLMSEYMYQYCTSYLSQIESSQSENEFHAITDDIWKKFDDENMYWCFSTDANAINKIG